MSLQLRVIGTWSKTEAFLQKLLQRRYFERLERYAQQGVQALQAATPVKTGRTAASWRYEIEAAPGKASIYWINDNVTYQGDPIAILLQYGHGTGTGGYVQGRDYINPAIKPVFDHISDTVWKVMVQS